MTWLLIKFCSCLIVAQITLSDGMVEPFRFEAESFHYAHGTFSLPLGNSDGPSITARGLEFELMDWVPDETPMPVFELVPFGDRICVQVTNIGWGDYEGPQLQLHTFERLENLRTSNGQLEGGIKAESVLLGTIPQGKNRIYTFQQKGIRFGYFADRPFLPTDQFPESLAPPWSISDTRSPETTRQFFEPMVGGICPPTCPNIETASVAGFPANGRAYFMGQLSNDNEKTRVPYFGRQFQPIDMSQQELGVVHWMGPSQLLGALMWDWEITFGNWDSPAAGAGGSGAENGITVDFGDPEKFNKPEDFRRYVTIPQTHLGPATLTFFLEFRTTRPGTFRVKVRPSLFHGDVSVDKGKRLLDGQVGAKTICGVEAMPLRVSIPRQYDIGWKSTVRFIEQVIDFDLHSKLKSAELPDFESGKQLYEGTLSARHWHARVWCDALLVDYVQEPFSQTSDLRVTQTAKWCRELSKKLATDSAFPVSLSSTRYSFPEREIIDRCFPIVCAKYPSIGVETALSFYELGDQSLMKTVMCIDETRSILKRHYRNRVADILEVRIASPKLNLNDPSLDVMCAALVGWRDWTVFLPQFDSCPWALGWCTGESRSKVLEKKVLDLCQEYCSKPNQWYYCIDKVIGGLSVADNSDFSVQMERVARTAAQRADTRVLLCCIDYLSNCRKIDLDRSLLTELSQYPQSAEVRSRASQLLE